MMKRRRRSAARSRLMFGVRGLALVLAFGCAPLNSDDELAEAVDDFHRQLNAGEIQAIYGRSAPELQAVTAESTFVKFLQDVRARMGPVLETKLVQSNVITGRAGTQTNLHHQTRFRRVTVNEYFFFVLVDGQWQLAGYRVDPPGRIE